MTFRLRRLDAEQAKCLFGDILGERPGGGGGTTGLARAEAEATPLVIEIADFGTRGLGGPLRMEHSYCGRRHPHLSSYAQDRDAL